MPALRVDGADHLRSVLAERGSGSLLRGWRRELDTDGSLDVGFQEFCEAASRLGVAVDAEMLFGDTPDSLTLVGLAPAEGQLVERFRKWMTSAYGGPGEMYMAFEGMPQEGSEEKLSREAFVEGCRNNNFRGREEEVEKIFELLDIHASGLIAMEEVMFLEQDPRRREGAILKAQQKPRRERDALLREVYEEDRGRDVSNTHRRAPRAWQAAAVERLPAVVQERRLHWRRRLQERVQEASTAFDSHIALKYGNGVRAWRQGLDPHSGFLLNKRELGRYCRRVNLQVDIGCLWKGLDQDDDGVLRLEEVGAEHCAVLARFKAWAEQNFGSCSASWDKLRMATGPTGTWKSDKTMMYQTFLKALAAFGWPQHCGLYPPSSFADQRCAMLCSSLDLHGCGIVSLQDLEWLDQWAAPEYLAADPDPGAWQELRAGMLKACGGQPLCAWRTFLDTNDQNHASWGEFKEACKKVGFNGNIGGVWRHLDADTSGQISLQEYDPHSAEILASFKEWIENNFGCVEFAFRSMDTDGSGSVCFSELKRACHRLGWQGCPRQIFEFLDIDVSPGKRTLSFKELAFLDSWVPQVELPSQQCQTSTRTTRTASVTGTPSKTSTPYCMLPPQKSLAHSVHVRRSESHTQVFSPPSPLASSLGRSRSHTAMTDKTLELPKVPTPKSQSSSGKSPVGRGGCSLLPFTTAGGRSIALLAPPRQ